ncbi:mitochondrial carrier domain-containing protein [Zopfochytrium polystomum]|nr:mitochondrial carrier domain-containing protein [Zopfochytrium polystomum]
MASDSVAHALAGAGGGMISMTLTYPLVTVSTRSQVSKTPAAAATASDGKKTPPAGQLDAFRKIIREEGVQGLYSGIESALFGIAVTQGVYYYWYELVKAAFEKAAGVKRAMTTLESMSAGAVAGAATVVITNPIWVVNTRQTVKKTTLADPNASTSSTTSTAPLSTLATVRKILREEGPGGFWRGIVPALILVVNPIIQYTVFERLKDWLARRRAAQGRAGLAGTDFFLLGAVSKLVATGVTYPYIVVKSRMQLKQNEDDPGRYKSVVDGIQKIAKAEGVQGLYKGLQAKLLQSVLASAFMFAFKEELFTSAVWLLVFLRMREAAPVKA